MGEPKSFNIIHQHWSGQIRSLQNGGNSTIERKVYFRKCIWNNGTKISSAWKPDCIADSINSWSGKKSHIILHNWLRKTSTATLSYITDEMADIEVREEGRIIPGIGDRM